MTQQTQQDQYFWTNPSLESYAPHCVCLALLWSTFYSETRPDYIWHRFTTSNVSHSSASVSLLVHFNSHPANWSAKKAKKETNETARIIMDWQTADLAHKKQTKSLESGLSLSVRQCQWSLPLFGRGAHQLSRAQRRDHYDGVNGLWAKIRRVHYPMCE